MAERVVLADRPETSAGPAPALLAMGGICKSYGEHKVLDR